MSHGGFCAQIQYQILERPLKKVFDWKVPNAGISKYLLIDKKFHCLYSDSKEKEKFLLTL